MMVILNIIDEILSYYIIFFLFFFIKMLEEV